MVVCHLFISIVEEKKICCWFSSIVPGGVCWPTSETGKLFLVWREEKLDHRVATNEMCKL
jgi:hypothetical protein